MRFLAWMVLVLGAALMITSAILGDVVLSAIGAVHVVIGFLRLTRGRHVE
jgi:membrane protein implicated in regulation of membrane protease activity